MRRDRKNLNTFYVGAFGYILAFVCMLVCKPSFEDMVDNTIYNQEWNNHTLQEMSMIGVFFGLIGLYGLVGLLFNIAKEKRDLK